MPPDSEDPSHPLERIGPPGDGPEPGLTHDELLARVYTQLRALAQQQMNAERPGHTLSATALVHEAYLRLVGPRQVPWQNRAHFYAAAAQAMRRILIDHARARGVRGARGARGGGPGRRGDLRELPDVAALAAGDPEQILAVDDAVTRLESEDPEAAAVVRLRFYAGLSVDQTAEAMGVSPRTAARLWTFARATLHRTLNQER